MKISPLSIFRINRTSNTQKTQPRLNSLGADTVSFGAKIPSRDSVYFPQYSKEELKYRELFTLSDCVSWGQLGKLTSNKGISLLAQLRDDKTVSDNFKARVLLGEGGNYSFGRLFSKHAGKATTEKST